MDESVKAKLPNPLPMGLKAPGRPKSDASKTCVRGAAAAAACTRDKDDSSSTKDVTVTKVW